MIFLPDLECLHGHRRQELALHAQGRAREGDFSLNLCTNYDDFVLKMMGGKTGCPVATSTRAAISGAKVAGQQQCSKSPHGFFPPRLDWSEDFTLPTDAKTVDVRVLVDRSIVEVFVGGGRVAAVMAYQPPNDVVDAHVMDLKSYTKVHLFATQATTTAIPTTVQGRLSDRLFVSPAAAGGRDDPPDGLRLESVSCGRGGCT